MSLQFGQYTVRAAEVFLQTRLSFALVNLKPIQVREASRMISRFVWSFFVCVFEFIFLFSMLF